MTKMQSSLGIDPRYVIIYMHVLIYMHDSPKTRGLKASHAGTNKPRQRLKLLKNHMKDNSAQSSYVGSL